jgi:hypothetical protein
MEWRWHFITDLDSLSDTDGDGQGVHVFVYGHKHARPHGTRQEVQQILRLIQNGSLRIRGLDVVGWM